MKKTINDLVTINSILVDKQVQVLHEVTPQKHIRKRPGKGGKEFTYVSGGYVRNQLNRLFGYDWDFEIMSEIVQGDEVIVKGKLTARVGDKTLTKMQYGTKEILFQKGTDKPVSIGNTFKAAATDALKKCAAEFGIAKDVYAYDDFMEAEIVGLDWDSLKIEFEEKIDKVDPTQFQKIKSFIEAKDEKQYSKIANYLNKLK